MEKREQEDGEFLRHAGCFKCGSGDALALYQKDDGSVDGFCWSCQSYHSPEDVKEYSHITQERITKHDMITQEELEEVQSKNICGWKERRITKSTCEKYGVYTEGDSENPIKRFYPITVDNDLKGYKIRFCETKDFGKVGYGKANSDMFGQSVFPSGGKFLCITEGEEDAMALYTALNPPGGKFETPVISPTAGAGSTEKQIKRNYEYITSFDKVIFFMDTDEQGKEATEKGCKLLPPGKAYTTDMKLKSPDEYTKKGRGQELVKMFWDAERYSPVDVSTFNQMWEDFENSASDEIITMPECMQELAYLLGGGPAAGEVTVVGAHTSIGKTSVLYTWIHHLVTQSDKKVGTLFLEGSQREFVRIMLSIHNKENLALKSVDDLDMDKLREDYHSINPDDSKLLNINHNGAFKTSDELLEKVRWMIKAGGCNVVFVDPLQAAVPNNENGTIDSFMDASLKLAKETNASIIIVSHTKKPSEDNPHKVSEYDLKGCVDGETEYLTEKGWVSIEKYGGEKIAVVNPETEEMNYEQPKSFIDYPSDGFYHLNTVRGVDMVLSKEHRVMFTHASERKWRFITTEELYKKHQESATGYRGRFPTAFKYEFGEGMDISDADLRLAVAFQADGHQRKDLVKGHVTFAFKRDRKIERLEMLLREAGITEYKKYKTARGITDFRVRLKRSDKIFKEDWWDVSREQAKIILDEIQYWDGHDGCYFTTVKENADYIQFLYTGFGVRSRIYTKNYDGRENDVYTVRPAKNNTVCIAEKYKKDKKVIEFVEPKKDERKYCFETSTGTWVARRNGCIFVTGNSSSINQIAFNTIILSRDKLGETPAIKNSTKVTLVKARRTSMTGDAGWLRFNPLTYQFTAGEDPYDEDDVALEVQEETFQGQTSEEIIVEDDNDIPWDD